MSKYINIDNIFHWGKHRLSDAVKYGNKNAEQSSFSYSTPMMYEIADEIDDAPSFETELPIERIRELVQDKEESQEPCHVCMDLTDSAFTFIHVYLKANFDELVGMDFCPNCGRKLESAD